jgi:hypothetical protein
VCQSYIAVARNSKARLHELLYVIGDCKSFYHQFISETLIYPRACPPDSEQKRAQLTNKDQAAAQQCKVGHTAALD